MKRIVLLMLTLFFFISSRAENKYLPFAKSRKGIDVTLEKATPQFEKRKTSSNEMIVTYNFDGAFVSSKMEKSDEYSLLHIEGFHKLGEVGAPALPVRSDYFVASVGEEVRVELINAQFTDYPNFEIYPALEGALDTGGAPDPEFYKNPQIYNSDSFYPQKNINIVADQQMRSVRLLKVNVCPVQYNPQKKTLRVYSELKYKFVKTDKPVTLNEANDMIYQIKSMVLNDGDIVAESKINNPIVFDKESKEYIIVTTDKFKPEAARFASWKASLGHTVDIVSKDRWVPNEVREAVASRYHRWAVKPKYLLIIGDNEDVPAMRFTTVKRDYFFTDLYYVCMDGEDDYTPDMAKGRLSVSSVDQAKVVIDKIISYEKTPTEDKAFYEHGLNCAQFQDVERGSVRDGYASRRFCHTSEEVRSYMIRQGYDVERIYYTDERNTPTHFNNDLFSNGEAIPDELLRSNGFQWNGSNVDIRNAINDGRFYILHRDHGFSGGRGWVHPRFVKEDVDDLNNGDKLPVVFSMNCHTGEFSVDECFAEKLLRKEGGGAVAVFGASYYSMSGPNDGLTLGMFESIWPNPGINPSFGNGSNGNPNLPNGFNEATTSLGDVLNLGLLRMDQTWAPEELFRVYTYRLFHLFGDPSMRIWKHSPQELNATLPESIDLGATQITVSNISTMGSLITVVQGTEILATTVVDNDSEALRFPELNTKGIVRITVSKDQHRTISKEYEINGDGHTPKASFFVEGGVQSFNIAAGNIVSFEDRSSFEPTHWEWNFGGEDIEFVDGTSANSPNPKVRFRSQGHYNVTLKVSNALGDNSYTDTDAVIIANPIGTCICHGTTNTFDYRNFYGILSVSMGGTTFYSKDSSRDQGYRDFTNKEGIRVTPGEHAKVSLELTDNLQNVKVFLDSNGDNTFSGQELIKSLSRVTGNVSFDISIPDNIPLYSMLRLRVIADNSNKEITGPCYSPYNGQVEDYAIVVMSGLASVHSSDVTNIQKESAFIGGKEITDGLCEIVEKGVVVSKEKNPLLSDIRVVSNDVSIADYQLEVSNLDPETTYYYRSYVINTKGISFGEERSFSTYGVMPVLDPLSIKIVNVYSHRIDLLINNPEKSDKVWGYVLKWSTEDQAIDIPVDGLKSQHNSIYLSTDEDGCIHLKLDPNKKYNYQLYRYVNDGESIDFEAIGSNIISATTLDEDEYPSVQVNFPVNFIKKVTLSNINNTNQRPDIGYHNFKNMVADIKPRFDYILNVGYDIIDMLQSPVIRVWIDLNRDGYLDIEKELYSNIPIEANQKECSIKLNLPNTINGHTLIRIGCFSKLTNVSFTKPSSSVHLEDYMLNVSDAIKIDGWWTGDTSSDWNDPTNWDNGQLPTDETDVVVFDKKANAPEISTAGSAKSILIHNGTTLSVRSGAKLQVSNDIDSKGTIYIYDGEVQVEGNLLSTTTSNLTVEDGTVLIHTLSETKDAQWAKGVFHLNGGVITFHDANFSSQISESSALKAASINITGSLGLSDLNWKDGFQSSVTFKESGEVHHLVCSRSKKITSLRELNVNVGNDTFIINNRFNDKTLKISERFNIVSGIVKGIDNGKVLQRLEVKDLNIEQNASFKLDATTFTCSGNITGSGVLDIAPAHIILSAYRQRQAIFLPITVSSLEQQNEYNCAILSDLQVTDQLIIGKGDLCFVKDADLVLDDQVQCQWAEGAISLGEGSKLRKQYSSQSSKEFTFQLYKDRVLMKITCSLENEINENSWLDFHNVLTRQIGVEAPYVMPIALEINAPSSLSENPLHLNVQLDRFAYQAQPYHWAYKKDKWMDAGAMEGRSKDFNFDSPNISITCMTQREAPETNLELINSNTVRLDNIQEGVEYQYRFSENDPWKPYLTQEIDITMADKFFVALANNDHSIESKSTKDLLGPLKIHTSLVTLNHNGNFKVYPNPIETEFTIENIDGKHHTYFLMDLYGRVLRTFIVEGKSMHFTVDIASGVYFLYDIASDQRVKVIIK